MAMEDEEDEDEDEEDDEEDGEDIIDGSRKQQDNASSINSENR